METAESWGVNFSVQSAPIVNNLRIRRIVIDLQPNGSTVLGPVFEFATSPPVLSTGQLIGVGSAPCATAQDDTAVFTSTTLTASLVGAVLTFSNDDITFTWDPLTPDVLTIDFPIALDPMNSDLNAFLPGERFRFGASVIDVTQNPVRVDGDGIGVGSTKVSVFFSNLAGDLPGAPVEANFVDSNLRRNYATVPDLDPDVCANRPFVLPDSPANGNGNDDQSFVLLEATGGGDLFAVRAKTRVTVPSICMNLFGVNPGGFEIQAETFAFYEPNTRRPKLIRIADFFCP